MKTKQILLIAGLGAVAIWYAQKKTREAVSATLDAVNPVNDENIFYSGVNAVGEKLTGDERFNLGSWLYEKLN
jgi:hypothetical protein